MTDFLLPETGLFSSSSFQCTLTSLFSNPKWDKIYIFTLYWRPANTGGRVSAEGRNADRQVVPDRYASCG